MPCWQGLEYGDCIPIHFKNCEILDMTLNCI